MDQDAFKCVMAALWRFRRGNPRYIAWHAAWSGMMLARVFDGVEDRGVTLWRLGNRWITANRGLVQDFPAVTSIQPGTGCLKR